MTIKPSSPIGKIRILIQHQELYSVFLAGFTFFAILGLSIYLDSGSGNIISKEELDSLVFKFDQPKTEGTGSNSFWKLGDIPARLSLVGANLIMIGTEVIAALVFFGLLIKRFNVNWAFFIFLFAVALSCWQVPKNWESLTLNTFFAEGIVTAAEKNGRINSGIMGKSSSTSKNITDPYLLDQHINYTVIYMMVITFICLCLRNGGKKWQDPNILLQRKRMIFSAIIMATVLLSISVIRNDTFFSWPASLLAGDQKIIALKLAHSFSSVIGTYFTMMLLILIIPPLIALELDIECAAQYHHNNNRYVLQNINAKHDDEIAPTIRVDGINEWRNMNGLLLSARSILSPLLGSLSPMLMTPFSNFISEIIKLFPT